MKHKEIIDLIKPNFDINKHGVFSFVNPYSYLTLRKCGNIKIDGLYVDGFLLAKLVTFFYKKVNVYSFDNSSLAQYVFNFAAENNHSIYIVGERAHVLQSFIKSVKNKFHRIDIIGSSQGYLNSDTEKNAVINDIIILKPDIVIVGMGTPTQEFFLELIKNKGFKGKAFSCGGFIRQASIKFDYFPKRSKKFNIRWLYRIFKEPHTIKRYLIFYPTFVVTFLFKVFNK